VILLAAACALASLATRRYGFVAFVAVYAFSVLVWFISVGRRRPRRRGFEVLLIALALRALFLFADPQLSADAHRYMWDGRELASGHDPYARPPLDDPRVNHNEIATIYPPHAELLFAIAHTLPLWRLLLIACEAAAVLLMPPSLAFAYATFPPLLFEGAWSAHVEVVAALLLLIAFTRDSGSAAGAAIGMKIIPIAAVPALLARSSRPLRFAALLAIVLIVPFIPFAIAGPVMPGMRDYATRWIFNSPAYDAVFAVVNRIPLKAFWTAIKDPLHLEAISDFVYHHIYADFVTRAILGICALLAIIAVRKRVAASIAALLLFSPAIHPWYWLVAVPVAMIERANVVLALALCAPFSYLLYAGASKWLVYALCYLPAIALLLLSTNESSAAAEHRAATAPRTARDTSPS
jgi:hypothetical protein